MQTLQLITRTLILVTLLIATALVAQAQATFVYVTANRGTDVNTCSRTSPCRTIQHGIDMVAAGGTVIVLESGDYASFIVNKSVTVEASTGITAVVVGTTGNAVTVTTASTVDVAALRGLILKGLSTSGSGILVTAQLRSLHIENCVIADFKGAGTSKAGIQIEAGGEYFIKDTVIRNSSFNGIFLSSAAGLITATIEHCRLENSLSEALRVENNAHVSVRDSIVAGNDSGFYATGVTADMGIENCLASNNAGEGVFVNAGATVRVSNSAIFKNAGIGLVNFNNSATLISFGNNRLNGNNGGGANPQTNGVITTVSQQ